MPLRLALVLSLGLLGTSLGCTNLRAAAGDTAAGGGASRNPKQCASCMRMCEVAGDARDNPEGVAKCKSGCAACR
jgi:hypothetical protein